MATYLFERRGFDINAAEMSRHGIIYGQVAFAGKGFFTIRFQARNVDGEITHHVNIPSINLSESEVQAFEEQFKMASEFAVEFKQLMEAADSPSKRFMLLMQACGKASVEDLAKAMIVAGGNLSQGDAGTVLNAILHNPAFGDLTDSETLDAAPGNLLNAVYDLAVICGFKDSEEEDDLDMDLPTFLSWIKR